MSWIDTLLAESSIWQIYRKSPRFWTNSFNAVVVAATATLLSAFAVLHLKPPQWAAFVAIYSLNDAVIGWAVQGFTYSATMLAFLLAGFTVFSTLTKPSLLAELAQIPHKDKKRPGHVTGVSELQFVFFAFINVFVHHMSFLALSAAIVLFGTRNGPLVLFGELLKSATSPAFFDLLQHVVFIFIGTWFILLFLKLKSFVWNLYQMVLIVIVSEVTTKPADTAPE